MTTDGTKYRLGLDMGTNSIGWAAVELDDNGEPRGVLDTGVRIFSDGRNPKDGSSLAVQRRLPRGQRRRRDRYLKRRDALMAALVDCGLMPADERDRKRKELVGLDPYAMRVLALDHPLEPYELGRALFHLDQRRGFKSNRKACGDVDQAKKTRAEINELRGRIAESGARTLGEFLARRRKKGKTVRARTGAGLYADRAMYENEFDKIRAAQAPHHDLRDDQWDGLRDNIFFQRPLKLVDPGWCQLEPGERRAAKSLPVTQAFRILQEVNNLKVRVAAGPERPLDKGERTRALHRLWSGKDIDLQKQPPTRDLGLPSGTAFNLSRGGRKTLKGDETTTRLKRTKQGKDLFGDRWLNLPLDERNLIVRFLLDTEDPADVRRKAMEEWGLNETQADRVSNVSLMSGYSNLSEKAIGKMLPFLEKGLGYADAVIAAGYPHHSDFSNATARERLPYYGEVLEFDVVGADPAKDPKRDGEPARYGRISNPTVHIGLNQLRRVVNRLIEVYGKPEEIVVELARDLKMNKEQKQDARRQQRQGRERNDRFREMLESAAVPVTAPTLRKLRLWEEQGPPPLRKLRLWEEQGPPQARLCPFTGVPLSFEMVVSNQTEIEHLLPWSRTWDDSMSNKVVCTVSANRDKGNRSPHEAFGNDPPGYDYQAMLDRAARLPGNKSWRFQPDAMDKFEDEGGFLDRQLNETRYLSRTARIYLAHLYDENQRVRVIPGRMTALLRRGWGLEGILPVAETGEIARKQRDDHRHHAVDAFVVANTTQGLLQRFEQAAGSDHSAEERLAAVVRNVLPWRDFDREELKQFLDRLVVSHKPDHGTRGEKGRTTGRLHNETAYGLIELSKDDGPSKVVARKDLSKFKRDDIDAVRDPTLQAALEELWDRVDGNTARFAQQAKDKGVRLNGRRQPVRRARVVDEQRVIPIRDTEGRAYKGYIRGGNEFADVWRMRNGSWRIAVIPKFDANQPGFDIEQFRPADQLGRPDPTAKRIVRLQIDDMGAFGEGEDRRIVRVRKINNRSGRAATVVLDGHAEAVSAKDEEYSASKLRKHRFRKVGVDEIGRVSDPGPWAP